jgi:hypothetical protein
LLLALSSRASSSSQFDWRRLAWRFSLPKLHCDKIDACVGVGVKKETRRAPHKTPLGNCSLAVHTYTVPV